MTATAISMSLRERRSEFAALRAMGYTRGRVACLIFAEAGLVCLVGTLVGGGLMFALYNHHGVDMGTVIPFMSNITIGPKILMLTVASALPFALATSIMPAIGIARQSVTAALVEGR
jgi:putative ABC transport system permease protein